MGIGEGRAGDRAPRLEPLATGRERPDARLHPVGDDQQLVEGEQGGQLGLVGLELMKSGPDGGVLGDGVLELDEGEREAVYEEHHARPADVPVLCDGELADGEPVVAFGVVEVQHAGLRAADGAVLAAELDRYGVHEHSVEGAVAGLQRRALGAGELAEGVLDGLGGERGVEQRESLSQTIFEDYLLVGLPFGGRSFG